MKILAGIVGGFILAVLGAILVATGMAGSGAAGGMYGAGAFFVCWLLGIVVGVTAPSAGKAWRRLLLTAAVLSFLMPLSGVLFTGSMLASTGASSSGAAAAGTIIGGGIVSGILGFVGFFMGITFLVIGLLVGRDKQVVYVERAPTGPVA